MASEKPRPPRGGREPPTIDASATEVKVEPPTGAERQPNPDEGSAIAATGPDTPVLEAEAAKSPEATSKPEKPDVAVEPPKADAPPPSPRRRESPPRRRSLFWPMLGSAIFGAVLALAALGLIWRFNVLEPYNIDVGGKLLTARLARVEAQVRDRASTVAPRVVAVAPAVPAVSATPSDTKALDELTARLAKLETAVAIPRPPVIDPALANRLTTLENAVKPLGEAVAANGKRDEELAVGLRDLHARIDATAKTLDELVQRQGAAASRADLDKVDARMVTLEAATKSLTASVTAAGAADKSADKTLRAAMLASALSSAVERGAPYVTELAALKPQVRDPQALAPLEPFAATGVPTQATLARELADLVPTIAATVEPAPNPTHGSYTQRLMARAREFVQVRPIGEASGDNAAAVMAGIAAKAARADISGALSDIAKLPPAAQAKAQAFVAKVQARAAAIAAAQRVAADALAALGKS